MKIDMKKPFVKIIAIIIGISLSGVVYLSLWSVFKYFGIVS